jgi:hypothetical protein
LGLRSSMRGSPSVERGRSDIGLRSCPQPDHRASAQSSGNHRPGSAADASAPAGAGRRDVQLGRGSRPGQRRDGWTWPPWPTSIHRQVHPGTSRLPGSPDGGRPGAAVSRPSHPRRDRARPAGARGRNPMPGRTTSPADPAVVIVDSTALFWVVELQKLVRRRRRPVPGDAP